MCGLVQGQVVRRQIVATEGIQVIGEQRLMDSVPPRRTLSNDW
jgi:hypothetical protein